MREAQHNCSQQVLTRNAARMILVTFSLTDSWRISDSTGTILYRRRYSHIWGLNASSHTQKIIWYCSWKPHLLLKTPMMLKNWHSTHLIFKWLLHRIALLRSETLKEMVTQTYWKELLRMSVQHTLHSNLHHYLSLYKQLVSESHLSKRWFFSH